MMLERTEPVVDERGADTARMNMAKDYEWSTVSFRALNKFSEFLAITSNNSRA